MKKYKKKIAFSSISIPAVTYDRLVKTLRPMHMTLSSFATDAITNALDQFEKNQRILASIKNTQQ